MHYRLRNLGLNAYELLRDLWHNRWIWIGPLGEGEDIPSSSAAFLFVWSRSIAAGWVIYVVGWHTPIRWRLFHRALARRGYYKGWHRGYWEVTVAWYAGRVDKVISRWAWVATPSCRFISDEQLWSNHT